MRDGLIVMLGNRNGEQFDQLFGILLMIYERPRIGRKELASAFGVSPQVVSRQIKILREQFSIKFDSSPKTGYTLTRWGFIEKEQFLVTMDKKKHRKKRKS